MVMSLAILSVVQDDHMWGWFIPRRGQVKSKSSYSKALITSMLLSAIPHFSVNDLVEEPLFTGAISVNDQRWKVMSHNYSEMLQ